MRSHKRFAIRQEARLRGASQRALRGLLIELSLDGCRIGNIDAGKFALGQSATILIDGFEPMEGYVRWAKDGCVGLRFRQPLHARALAALLNACRAPGAPRTAHA
ncbi:MAG TPA: PilZ domain-containing protein [Novosphingobium sp.]